MAYETQLPPKFEGRTIRGEVSYRRDAATGLSVPTRSVTYAPDGVHTVVFDDFRVGPNLGDGHFTLASFGIAEAGLHGPQRYESRPYFWLAVATAFSLSVAIASKLALDRMSRKYQVM